MTTAHFAKVDQHSDILRLALEVAQLPTEDLGSGLIDHSQKMTDAAIAMAEKKVWAQRS